MRKRQSSLTAAGIAVLRALESAKPEGVRLLYDPYARQFAGEFLYGLIAFFDRLGYSEWRGPGVVGFLTARDRYIDDYLQSCLDAGLRQLVILGAGFDARAYRFEPLKRGVKVFEVDHPATQGVKLKKLIKHFGALPDHVTYVPIDFNTQTLEQRLAVSGYDPQRKTLFIWQGVTQYLTPEAVDGTLAFVAGHSGPGSAIIFDYMDAALLAGSPPPDKGYHGELSGMRRNRWLSGESLVFGIPEDEITAFLETRGFQNVQNAGAQALKERYFTGANAGRTVAQGYAIASATVRQDAGSRE
ncbi:MAG: SAM-dependent methyltransferase [Anaerolineae bacterium]|nr:SAM-dependent methyltransferase [Anaerolineae bacterium]